MKGLKEAEKAAFNNQYEECLFKASLAKAEANAFLSIIGVSSERLKSIVSRKLNAAKEEISKEESFPILAYSYYEYANTLLEDQPATALTYAEYALELANLDIYFSGDDLVSYGSSDRINWKKNFSNPMFVILLGIILGLILGRVMYGSYDVEKKN